MMLCSGKVGRRVQLSSGRGNYLPDQCPNQSYSIEERRGVLNWLFFGCALRGAEVLPALA